MRDLNEQIDRIDHQHDKNEKPDDCMICRAEEWIDDLKARGTPWNEIRNMHMIASHAALEREEQRRKLQAYMKFFMELVNRLGGSVVVTAENLNRLKGRLVQEIEGDDGMKFTIMDSPAGAKTN